MAYKAITIYTPAGAEPHIAAEDDAFIHNAQFGGRSGTLGELACARISDNTVRLSGGGVSNLGYVMYIPRGSAHDLTIATGTQGLGRHDLVVSRFTRGGGASPDTHDFATVQGEASAQPVDPALMTGEPVAYGDINEIALFRVTLNGITIVSVTPLADCLDSPALSAAADRLSTARTIALSGDVQGTCSFDGSDDVCVSSSVTRIGGVKITVSDTAPQSPETGELWISYGD